MEKCASMTFQGVPHAVEVTLICSGALMMMIFLLTCFFLKKAWRISWRFWYVLIYGKGHFTIYSGEEIEMATFNYSEKRILWKSKHGTVYLGMLRNGMVVAVKVANLISRRVTDTFMYEEVALAELEHPHIVCLLGLCLDNKKPMVIYEYRE